MAPAGHHLIVQIDDFVLDRIGRRGGDKGNFGLVTEQKGIIRVEGLFERHVTLVQADSSQVSANAQFFNVFVLSHGALDRDGGGVAFTNGLVGIKRTEVNDILGFSF